MDYKLPFRLRPNFVRWSQTVLTCWILFLTAVSASAAPEEKPDGAAQSDGFVNLIAKDSLKGWRGDLDSWNVKDGVLIGTADGTLKANRFIVADIPPVKNFELLAEVRVTDGGNSGLQYRSTERPDLGPFVVTGYQCDVVSNRDEYNGMLYEERGRRILAHTGQKVIIDVAGQPWVVGCFPVRHFAPGEWHSFRVLVEGNHHQHWIDGQPTTDVIDLDERGRSLEGILGVQVHVGPAMEICYRNMKLRRLADNLPLMSPEGAPIPESAEKVVPQGGWKMAGHRDMNARLENASIGSIPNLHRCGDILLAGQPSEQDLKLLAQSGYKTVITLRAAGEVAWNEKQVAEAAGMTYLSLPISSPDDITDELLQKISDELKKSSAQNKVLLHCASANRVGAVWTVHRVLNGRLASEEALQEAKVVGLRSPAMEKVIVDYLQRKKRL